MMDSDSSSFNFPYLMWREVSKNWLRIVIVACVLLISTAMAIRPSLSTYVILFGLLLFAGGVIVILRWPAIGFAILILANLVVPFSIETVTQTNLDPTVLLVPFLIGLSLLGYLASPKKKQLTLSRCILAGIVFIFFVLLSFLFNNLINSPDLNASIHAQIGQLAIFILSISAFILMAQQVGSLKWLEHLTWLFVGLGGIYIAARLTPVLGDILLPLFSRDSTGSIFWTWLVAISFSQAVFNKELHKGLRFVLAILCMSTLYVGFVISQSWVSGWLPPLIALFVILLIRFPKYFLFITLLSIPLLALQLSRVKEILLMNEAYSVVTREAAGLNILQLIRQSPILGLGPANYYWYTASEPIMGWYVYFSSHNNYIDIIAQTGLLGFASFIWFIWEIARSGLRLRSKAPQGFARAYVYGA
ncbi:O-antigen ligase family protein, partial [bacterium]|nr:O-antigen ligase family protein [bacterium]